jgi:uncharacterized membrane protein
MPSWPAKAQAPTTAALAIVTVAYPLLFYLGHDHVAPVFFVALALGLAGLRLTSFRPATIRLWRAPLAIGALGFVALAVMDGSLAAKAYPVLISLGFAAAFGWSLLSPPSLVERIARIRHPDLPPRGQVYCRNVTLVWFVWLVFNALVSAALAVWGDVSAWALWTGLLSYLVMGLLFLGEIAMRRRALGVRTSP